MRKLFQKKLFLLIIIPLIVLNLLVIAGSRLILYDSFLHLEQEALEENLRRAKNALQNDIDTLGTLCADWAVWDDSYNFVQDKNETYISSNLGDLTLVDLELNAILIFDASGSLVFGKGMDLAEEQVVSVSPELLNYFQQEKKYWPPQMEFNRQDGILMLPEGPLLVSFRPVITSEGRGPARGIFVMVRWLNESVIENLSERAELAIGLHLLTRGQVESVPPQVHIQPEKERGEHIYGDTLWHDFQDNPSFNLRVTMPRTIFQQGQKTIGFFQLSFFFASVFFAGLLYAILLLYQYRQTVAEKRFRCIFENATDGLFVVESPRKLTLINPAAKKLLGINGDLQEAERFCHAQPELQGLISAGLKGKIAGPVELDLPDSLPNNSYVRAYMSPLVCERGKQHGAIATLQDISREKELERLKNEFIAAAAHELNTPLSVIIGYADLLISEEHKSEQEKLEFCSLINEKAHALEKIVADLLHLGKIESGHQISLTFEPFDLHKYIEQIVDVFRKKETAHDFVVKFLEEHLVAVADRHRIGQVLDNLLSNAVKYSPNGGQISVSVGCHEKELLVCVKDQGVGLTEDQFGRVFEKFYRVDNSATAVRGLGLGLNICRNIIETHGGRIWLESMPGKGTRFYFTLPHDA